MNYLPVAAVTDRGVSGSVAPQHRPGLGKALSDLDRGAADVLIVSELSRIGRRTRDVLDVSGRAARNGWGLVVLDLAMDTTTPTGRLCLTVMAAVAELERELTRDRTRRALEAAKARGQRLGRPVSPETRAAGRRATELRADGLTWRAIAQQLTAEGYPTANGGAWHPSTARKSTITIRRDAEAEAARARWAAAGN